ncbi:MAG: hypothetical protein CMJ89_17440 [Planctomycetes bacterium]|jgi:thiamine biosynthesis lipoprotein|nr:hypothetical protein [Planctomycetota bacterium]
MDGCPLVYSERGSSPIRENRPTLWQTLVLLGPGLFGCAGRLERHGFEEPHMGTVFRIVLWAEDELQARGAARAAFGRIAELDGCLSDYDPASELSLLRGKTTWQRVSPDLWSVLAYSAEVSLETEGAFDVTVLPLTRLWRRARRRGELPAEELLEAARRAVGRHRLQLDPRTRSIRFCAPDMGLDLGGVAKGYALDQALQALSARGVSRALVDGGGDVVVSAAPPGRRGWRIELAGWEEACGRIELSHAAVATSGDTERFFELEGRRYSHLVDPRSGRALVDSPLVTVIARRAMAADAWASALSVTGPAGLGSAVRNGVEARILAPEGGGSIKRTTAGFRDKLSSAGTQDAPPRR